MIGAIIVFALIPIVALIANAVEDHRSSISFDGVYNNCGLPIVTLTNNGNSYNFLVDTGANLCVLNKKWLDSIDYVAIEGQGTMYGMEGNIQTVEYVQIPLSHGKATFNPLFQVIDVSNAFDKIERDHSIIVHGVLGTQFLEDNKGKVDFIEHELKYESEKN